MTRFIVAWGPAGGWAGVLFLLSEVHGAPRIVWFALHDKLVHFGLYFVLGAALAWGQRKSPFPVSHVVALLAGVAYGAVDEWHQSFVPGRMPSMSDFYVDVLGLSVAYLLVQASWKAVSRLRSVPST